MAAHAGGMLPSPTLAFTACSDPPQSINKLPCVCQGLSWGSRQDSHRLRRKRQGSPSTGQRYRRTQSDSCLGLCRRSPTGRPDVAPLPCMGFNSGSLASLDRGSRWTQGQDLEGRWGKKMGPRGQEHPGITTPSVCPGRSVAELWPVGRGRPPDQLGGGPLTCGEVRACAGCTACCCWYSSCCSCWASSKSLRPNVACGCCCRDRAIR